MSIVQMLLAKLASVLSYASAAARAPDGRIGRDSLMLSGKSYREFTSNR